MDYLVDMECLDYNNHMYVPKHIFIFEWTLYLCDKKNNIPYVECYENNIVFLSLRRLLQKSGV
jgi:hypothetical protein